LVIEESNMSIYKSVNGTIFHSGAVIRGIHSECEFCREGELFKIVFIRWQKEGGVSIGIFSPKKKSGFHDLEGTVPDHQGYWIGEDKLVAYFTVERLKLTVKSPLMYRGKDLINKKGVFICEYDKLLSDMRSGYLNKRPSHIFVEFEDYVCGTSCDGFGKKGHCAMVPRAAVKFEKETEANALFL